MFHVHHLNNSRSQRIPWLLEVLGAEYQIHAYQRDAKTNLAPVELAQIHPLGRAPVIVHNDKVVAESGAICEYIARQFPDSNILPSADSEDYIDVQFWSHFAEGSLMPALVTSMVLEKARAKAKPFFVRFIADKIIDGVMNAYFGRNIAQNLSFIEAHLADKTYFVNEQLSLADIQMSFGLEALFAAGKLSKFPNMTRYVKHVQSLDSHQRATQQLQSAESSAA